MIFKTFLKLRAYLKNNLEKKALLTILLQRY